MFLLVIYLYTYVFINKETPRQRLYHLQNRCHSPASQVNLHHNYKQFQDVILSREGICTSIQKKVKM